MVGPPSLLTIPQECSIREVWIGDWAPHLQQLRALTYLVAPRSLLVPQTDAVGWHASRHAVAFGLLCRGIRRGCAPCRPGCDRANVTILCGVIQCVRYRPSSCLHHTRCAGRYALLHQMHKQFCGYTAKASAGFPSVKRISDANAALHV